MMPAIEKLEPDDEGRGGLRPGPPLDEEEEEDAGLGSEGGGRSKSGEGYFRFRVGNREELSSDPRRGNLAQRVLNRPGNDDGAVNDGVTREVLYERKSEIGDAPAGFASEVNLVAASDLLRQASIETLLQVSGLVRARIEKDLNVRVSAPVESVPAPVVVLADEQANAMLDRVVRAVKCRSAVCCNGSSVRGRASVFMILLAEALQLRGCSEGRTESRVCGWNCCVVAQNKGVETITKGSSHVAQL